ncbi:FAD-dependent oxidoreductase [Nocardia mexicana]|uniref:2-polyprenyl-6-methoxyphenol hydroxylase-like FAD-dependent oxidoreductase n=1 Tax=Nocardia mexicana TaxID=279262 RepID=A0A370HFG0_9NOCA|nr:FAD-dependent oxidoreductase [Nocardia mexicana]RDI55745.1 2-polyprenyl-6-methoxyphenol hydroxylase-like FAD-dependent oxidoreductase [Nocardia mexicana]
MNAPAHTVDTRVLIVGGGITGLTTALLLARAGVRPVLVERHPSTALQPQARAFNPRTMEIYRSLGLEQQIRERTSILAELPEMIGVDTLAGEERFRVDVLAQVRPPAALSPTDWAMIDQDELERIVRAAAENHGADVRFGTELIEVDSAADGVTAIVRDLGSDTEYRVHAEYLVASDGNRARIRTRLGIGADGPGELVHVANFLCDADLSAALRGRRFLLAYFDRPTTGTVLVPGREPGRWAFGVPFGPESGKSAEDFTEQRCIELARRAIGDPDLELTFVPAVPGTDRTVTTTRIGCWVARRYRAGRIFFVGDAAHVVPPTGSFGASTGIADAHNLAWKLAAVLDGRAGDPLLDTYEDERRPVALITLDQAMQRLQGRHHGSGDSAASIDDLTMIFGYRYGSGAVCAEGTASTEPVEDPRAPSGRPGLRAPHVRLRRGETALSTVDLFHDAFTLLTGPAGDDWAAAAEKVSATLGLDMRVLRIGADLEDVDDRFPATYGLADSGASLVRPDGFTAWRSATLPSQPEGELLRALTQVLGRTDA